MKRTIDCFFHTDCVDGFVAACLVKMFHPDDVVNFHPTDYSFANLKNIKGKDLIFVDIAPPPEFIMGFGDGLDALLILDHHASALDAWRQYLPAVHANENYQVRFDLNESGASLTWKHFRNTDLPELIEHVRNYDLYQFDNKGKAKIVQAYLEVIAMEYFNSGNEDRAVTAVSRAIYSYEKFTPMGTLLSTQAENQLRVNRVMAKDIARRCAIDLTPTASQGYARIMTAQCPRFLRNYVADVLLQDCDVVFLSEDIPQTNTRTWSVRSRPTVDLQRFYKNHGGGGHPHSGGFRSAITGSALEWIQELMTTENIADCFIVKELENV